jgi:ATP-binding cassette subfamily B protein
MLRMEWHLALVVIFFAPIPALIGAWAAPELMQRERRLVERWNSIYGRFNEVLAGMMTVKGFAMEEEEKRRFLEGVRQGNEVVRRGVRIDSQTGSLRAPPNTTAETSANAGTKCMAWVAKKCATRRSPACCGAISSPCASGTSSSRLVRSVQRPSSDDPPS